MGGGERELMKVKDTCHCDLMMTPQVDGRSFPCKSYTVTLLSLSFHRSPEFGQQPLKAKSGHFVYTSYFIDKGTKCPLHE